MNDLIRKSEVLETLEKLFEEYGMLWKPTGKNDGFASAVPRAIMEMSTAYDVEEKVRQLEELQTYYLFSDGDEKMIVLDEVLEVIRGE